MGDKVKPGAIFIEDGMEFKYLTPEVSKEVAEELNKFLVQLIKLSQDRLAYLMTPRLIIKEKEEKK